MLARTRLILARASAPRAIRLSSSTANPPPLEGEVKIYEKLTARFSPSNLQVQDVSGGCGTFYAISITSSAFKDLSIIQQHRLVNETLKEDIKEIHGLQLKTSSD